ncbi:MAG: DUF6141 family protein [Planctomycetaceae bacterium]|nr:DUF6141 family protein [Planctomycetaceae bacterium]
MIETEIFSEEQKPSKWIRLIFSLDLFVFIGAIIFVIHYLHSQNKPIEPTMVIILALAGIIPFSISILIGMCKLETKVCANGLYVRFFPLHINFKKFPFEDINECYACEYKPIAEYGGWGIRYGKNGKAYNMKGNRGLQIVFKNGKKLLIGSQKSEELTAAINSAIKK